MVMPRLGIRLRLVIGGLAGLDFALLVRACERAGYFVTHDLRIVRREAVVVSTSWPFVIAMVVYPIYVFYKIFRNREVPIPEDAEKFGLVLLLIAEIVGLGLYALRASI
jgi:hypothetical protein